MSRSNGKYPNFTKLDVSPDDWPDNYWDRSRQCSACGYQWPHPHLFEPSPCCSQPTNLLDKPPDLRWPEAISKLMHARFEKFYEEYNEGVDDERLVWEDVKTNGHYDEDKAKHEVEEFLTESQNH